MARASSSGENAATNGITAVCAYVAPHTGDPGTTGASELASDTREAVTWGTASSGTASNTNAISTPIPASTTISYVGFWSAATSGTYEIGAALSSSVTTGSTAASLTFAAGALTLSSS